MFVMYVCMLTVSDRDSCCVCNVCLYVDSVGQTAAVFVMSVC